MYNFSFIKVFLVIIIILDIFCNISAFRLVQDKGKVDKLKKSDSIKDQIEKFLNQSVILSESLNFDKYTPNEITEDEPNEINAKIVTKKKTKLETKITTKPMNNESDISDILKKIKQIRIKESKSNIVEKKIQKNITKLKDFTEDKEPKKKVEEILKKSTKIEPQPIADKNITEPISTVVETLTNKPKVKPKEEKDKKLIVKQIKDETVTKTVQKEIIESTKPMEKIKTKINVEQIKDETDKLVKKEILQPTTHMEKIKTTDKISKTPEHKKDKEIIKTEAKKTSDMPKEKIDNVKNIKLSEKNNTIETKTKPKQDKEITKSEVKKTSEISKEKPKTTKLSENVKITKEAPVKIEKDTTKIVTDTAKLSSEESLKIEKSAKTTVNLYDQFMFIPDFSVVENEECKKQGLIVLDNLKNRKMWAMKMYDASAKPPSNILRGNLNQLGGYDECTSVHARIPMDEKEPPTTVKISGKYCLAYVDLEATESDMKLPVNLAQGRAFIRSKNTDPGHFIPRFSSIRWGVCVPAACDAEDVQRLIGHVLPRNATSGVRFNVLVPNMECQAANGHWTDRADYMTFAAISLLAVLAMTTIVATTRDYLIESVGQGDTLHQVLMAFSLKRTTAVFLQESTDEIPCIHGVRAICTVLLYVAHKLIPVGHALYTNRVTLTEISNNPLSIILRMSVIYTDTFLLLSGVLTAYHMSRDMETKGHIPWINRIFARIIRLAPTLLIVLLCYAYIMDMTGNGPLWPSVISENAKLCQEHWWKNLLFIQNLFPFEEMCATHTHQLALDMQLFLIAPILVWLLYSKPFLGVVTTLMLHVLSVVLRYYTTLNYRLSLVIYHGISISQLYRTANLVYASSLHRVTPYVAGVGLGVLLRQLAPNPRIPKVLLILGWLSATYFVAWTMYSPAHLSYRNYQYNSSEAAQFAALCSLAWALALSWIIFASYVNSTGYLNIVLSSKPMVLLSKLSYTMYLTQFLVFFYNVGTIRTSSEFRLTDIANIPEFLIVIAVSLILFLVVDLPTQKIKNILFKPTPIEKSEDLIEEKPVENHTDALCTSEEKSDSEIET